MKIVVFQFKCICFLGVNTCVSNLYGNIFIDCNKKINRRSQLYYSTSILYLCDNFHKGDRFNDLSVYFKMLELI